MQVSNVEKCLSLFQATAIKKFVISIPYYKLMDSSIMIKRKRKHAVPNCKTLAQMK